MYLTAIQRTIRQIPEPAFFKVLIMGLLLTALALIAATVAAGWAAPLAYESDWGWVNTLLQWAVHLVTVWLAFILFVPLSAVFVGLFLDSVVDTVEERYYPHRRAGPPLGVVKAGWLGLRLAAAVLVFNVAVLPLYVLTLWIPFAAVVIFYGVNAYLLGWGFYDLIATRHMEARDAARHRRTIRSELLLSGLLVTFLFTVPVVNLVAPILGAAFVVHIFHATLGSPATGEV
jgi:uncharacterized protein involved in cysteine biosynthesis